MHRKAAWRATRFTAFMIGAPLGIIVGGFALAFWVAQRVGPGAVSAGAGFLLFVFCVVMLWRSRYAQEKRTLNASDGKDSGQ